MSFSESKRKTGEIRSKIGSKRHKELSNYRAGIEGTPSVLKRVYQLEHLPVRGRVRSKIWVYASIIAQNFKRCVKCLRKMAVVPQ
ncbi:transposase [Caldifermentibacillus hisashii]|uniref:transposase n=1 Tax=Caldifermentibacillus hisashii TaxID=996558 RepID=UPI00399CF53B